MGALSVIVKSDGWFAALPAEDVPGVGVGRTQPGPHAVVPQRVRALQLQGPRLAPRHKTGQQLVTIKVLIRALTEAVAAEDGVTDVGHRGGPRHRLELHEGVPQEVQLLAAQLLLRLHVSPGVEAVTAVHHLSGCCSAAGTEDAAAVCRV